MDRDSLFYEAVDVLKQLIRIPSFSREESVAVDFLSDYLQKEGVSVERKGNNLILFSPFRDDSRPFVLLNSHIDTVKPAAGWSSDPFFPLEKDEKLFGLGSNDAGASLVSMLQAFRVLCRKTQPVNFIYVISCEEEISGKGGIESVLEYLPPVALGIVGEPTSLQAAVAEKGLMVLDGVVRGVAGHAAREEGENALYKVLPVIEWFRNKEFPKVSPLLGPVKMSVTMIQAGTQHNVVPAECRFVVDVRTNDCYRNEELFQLIREECGCEINARSFRLNSSSIPAGHSLVQRASLLGCSLFGSPTLSDQALMPFTSLKIGPGDSARSHAADEFICCREIREAIDFYIRLLDNLEI